VAVLKQMLNCETMLAASSGTAKNSVVARRSKQVSHWFRPLPPAQPLDTTLPLCR